MNVHPGVLFPRQRLGGVARRLGDLEGPADRGADERRLYRRLPRVAGLDTAGTPIALGDFIVQRYRASGALQDL